MAALKKIVIVGAGPSGLLLALLLTSLSPAPEITILDAAQTLNRSPRATHHGPAAIAVLRRAGILDEVRRRGYLPTTLCWRTLHGPRLAGFDRKLMHDQADAMTIFSVGDLCALLVEELEKKGVHVTWGQKVVALGGTEDDAEQAWAETETGEKQKYPCDFLIGCDGGNSAVRRLMFGSGNFPGFTWEEQIVATNTYYDFPNAPPDWDDTNFVIDNTHWYMAAKISHDGLWRISYGELPGLSNEELIARQPMKFEAMLPGNPKPGDYKVVSISPYKVHQRCVEAMAKGRVALAADAAHLCNPFGGLGLLGGIVDVDCLFDSLRGVHCGKTDQRILKIYSDVRIQKYQEIVNPVSTANLKRLCRSEPAKVMETDEFLQKVKQSETDSALSMELQNFSYSLKHDMEAEWTL
ncbi:hypothetical protein N0V93_006812 [Gnomoniopsis smithogilvyi]|uniref:FAD-binding domain-containing protein n=1 Tax=Gnomoniopsis smithogilvyi TaxID=1191159 RepID=A0A9W9CVZ8_9PEZI|nr:hypothetical protein N0V93_006812 [Gnomoniopsis smithogilvyi]